MRKNPDPRRKSGSGRTHGPADADSINPIVDRFKALPRGVQVANGLTVTGLARTLEGFCHRLADPLDKHASAEWRAFCGYFRGLK